MGFPSLGRPEDEIEIEVHCDSGTVMDKRVVGRKFGFSFFLECGLVGVTKIRYTLMGYQ